MRPCALRLLDDGAGRLPQGLADRMVGIPPSAGNRLANTAGQVEAARRFLPGVATVLFLRPSFGMGEIAFSMQKRRAVALRGVLEPSFR